MRFEYNDGGRKAAGYQGKTGDCVCRSIAIATKLPYAYVYMLLNEQAQQQRITKRQPKRGSARTGIYKTTIKQIMEMFGWRWTPTMAIGSGCTVHLRRDELPTGRLIVSVSKHIACVIDGVINDTHDCSRRGTRCVYGYWTKD
jgi:hypothetical protein